MTTVADISTVWYAGDLRADALLQQMPDWNHLLPARTTLYYTFDLGVIDAATEPALTAFNAAQRAATVQILGYVSSVCGISFEPVATGAAADLHFGACDVEGVSFAGLTQSLENWSALPDGTVVTYTADAFIYLDDAEFESTNAEPTTGSRGYQVLLHEIGHALGLGHPFDGRFVLPVQQDNTDKTVMSYTPGGSIKSTFQGYDLLALRWIYGDDGLRGSQGYNSTNGPSLDAGMNTVTGTARADTLVGTRGRDTLVGLGGNDRLDGGAGDDDLNGGSGNDLAVYASTRAGATVSASASGFIVASGLDGTDTLVDIERLKFADASIALDLSGNAGTVAKILGAVFGRDDVPRAVYAGIGLHALDSGVSYEDLVQLAIDARLGVGAGHGAVVDLLHTNIVGSGPPAEVRAYFVDLLDDHRHTVAELGVYAAELELNQANIDLVGLSQQGLEYVPYAGA